MENITGKKTIITKREDYAYLTGRIRALESGFLNKEAIEHIFEADSVDEIAKVVSDNGFVVMDRVESAISSDVVESYRLVESLIPDKDYIDALLLANDYHNLKVILKVLIPHSIDTVNTESTPLTEQSFDNYSLPDLFNDSNDDISYEDLTANFAHPSKYDPLTLYEIIRNSKNDLPDIDFKVAIDNALRAYTRYTDPGDIDVTIDRHYFKRLSSIANMYDNNFLKEYAAFRIDSTNMGILLRMRAMKAPTSRLEGVAIEGIQVSVHKLSELLHASSEDIVKTYNSTSCESLTEFVDTYGTGYTALRFNKAIDNYIIKLLKKTKIILWGPEVALAYLIAKDLQAKNINIALTCVRNKVPSDLAHEMMRDTF